MKQAKILHICEVIFLRSLGVVNIRSQKSTMELVWDTFATFFFRPYFLHTFQNE